MGSGYDPRWLVWGRGDASSGIRVGKLFIYHGAESPVSDARVFWDLERICSVLPGAGHAKASIWLNKAGAPANRKRFCMQCGADTLDWRPGSQTRYGKAAQPSRAQWLQPPPTCGTRHLLGLLVLWTSKLHKASQIKARELCVDIVAKCCAEVPERLFCPSLWLPRAAVACACDAQPLASVGACPAAQMLANSAFAGAGSDKPRVRIAQALLHLRHLGARDICAATATWQRDIIVRLAHVIDAEILGGAS